MSLKTMLAYHLGSNPGYAIAQYEKLFYRAALELGGGDASRVFVGYRDYKAGKPWYLPDESVNCATWDYYDTSRANVKKMARYAGDNGVDLVVLFDCDPTNPISRSLKSAGVKSVVSYWGAPLSGLNPPWKLLLKRIQVMTSSSKADWVVCESQAMADTATLGRGFPASRTRVIHQGVDIERFRPRANRDYVYEALGIPRDRKVIIYTGHMEERKGVHILIAAAIELLAHRGRKDVSFLICGNRPGETERLEKLYAGLGLEDAIRFGGYRSDLPEIYSSCYAGVTPTTGWDSFPYGPIEMAASGIPVVASRLQGLVESVLDGQTGMHFEPGNAHELADQLEKLLNDPALADRMGRAGRERGEKELNLEAHYRRVMSFFREAVES